MIDIDDWELVRRTQEEDPSRNVELREKISIESIREYFSIDENKCRIYGEEHNTKKASQ